MNSNYGIIPNGKGNVIRTMKMIKNRNKTLLFVIIL